MDGNAWSSSADAYVTPGLVGDAWAAEAAAAGGVGAHLIVYAGPVPASAEVRAALALPESEREVILRRRVMLLDDVPVETSDAFYPMAVAAGTALANVAKIRGGAVRLLADLGYTASRVVETVTARHPTEEEADLMRVAADRPMLVQSRTCHNADGRPYEHSVMVMHGNRRLVYRMTT